LNGLAATEASFNASAASAAAAAAAAAAWAGLDLQMHALQVIPRILKLGLPR
jgi:hypothetical protein